MNQYKLYYRDTKLLSVGYRETQVTTNGDEDVLRTEDPACKVNVSCIFRVVGVSVCPPTCIKVPTNIPVRCEVGERCVIPPPEYSACEQGTRF